MKMRKLHFIALILLVLTSGMLFAWDGFNYVAASELESGIRLDWQAKNEYHVYSYVVWRSRSESNILHKCYEVISKGDGATYSYVDVEYLQKSAETGNFKFNYYVRAVMTDGSYKNSDVVQVSLTSLGVTQQTWGSIKAMFR